MRFYNHTITKTDLFLLIHDMPQWLHTNVDGSHSEEECTPMYCRLKPKGEVALVHVVKWFYTNYLAEIGEEEARTVDSVLVDQIARIEHSHEELQPKG